MNEDPSTGPTVDKTPSKNAGRKKLSADQIEARENEAYRLRLLGKSQEEIAERFEITTRQVRTYLSRAKTRAVDDLRRLHGRAGVERQFVVLNHLLDEALAAWERSQEPEVTKSAQTEKASATKLLKGPDGKDIPDPVQFVKTKAGQREKGNVGDPAFLQMALKASAEIRALLGLDAPAVKRLLLLDDPLSKAINDNEDLRTLPPEELLVRYRATIGLGSGVE